jgi:Mg-chelatase subunit ChlD
MTEEDTIPPEFLCPISKKIMKDPVIMSDGQTYDRESITQALSVGQVSPITGQSLSIDDAKPNSAIKNLIEKYMATDTSIIQPVQDSSTNDSISLLEFSASYAESNSTDLLHIAIKPNDNQYRPPIGIIAMIDVSDSMDSNACENISGLENINLSRLQLVQHSLKTIIQTLNQQDSIQLITFSNSASITLQWTKMDSDGKKLAMNTVETFSANGGTNIWDALRVGINEAAKFRENTSVILFTDGEPNINPSMGIIPSLKDALSGIKAQFTISTFSFGYRIDSGLMENIAQLGNGIYGYCPDVTMVGTIFINYLANFMTTLSQNVVVSVDGGKYKSQHLISLSANKTQNIFIEVPCGVAKDVKIQVDIHSTHQKFNLNSSNKVPINFPALRDQIYRKKFINLIESNLDNITRGQADTLSLFQEMQEESNPSDFMKNIMIDLVNSHPNHGQVQKSFETNFYKKWGKDYLRSLMRFHILEQCGNFKDESLQLYATPQFAIVRKAANKIFLNLPPPTPKPAAQAQTTTYYQPPPQQHIVHMDRFYDRSGVCFDGDSQVELKNGIKNVKELKRGDELKDGGKVVCLVEVIMKRIEDVVEINGTLFTPYHPIKWKGKWIFPCDIAQEKKKWISSWFNLVLSGNKVIRLNDIEAITLGHDVTEGVLRHPYFGTKAIVKTLKKHSGFKEGKIVFSQPLNIIRDENGLISSLF